jgi:regulator of RNase E activity RraA
MSALQQNLAGLIVNGAVRDIDFLNDINFPVYSTSVNFVAAKATELRDVKVPDTVRLGEVIIKPNDWIFGDSDGLLLIQEKYVSAVFFGALMLKGREEKLKKDISDGKTLAQLSGMEKFLEGSGDLRYKGGIEELSSSQT